MPAMALPALAAFLLLGGGAEPQERVTLNADHVWGRGYAAGADNPVLITIDNPGKAIQGTLVLRWALDEAFQKRGATPSTVDGAQGSTLEIPVTLPEKSRRRHFATMPGAHGGPNMGLWVFLMSGRNCLARFSAGGVAFKEDLPVVGQVGLGGALGTVRRLAQPAVCRPEDLPDRWHGYLGLKALVWLDADAAEVREPTQIEALRQWIASGGHLVIARADTAGLAGTFLEGLAPAAFRGAGTHSSWDALAEWCGAAEVPSGEAAVLHARPRGGRVLIGTDDRPLAIAAPFGRGRVTFLPFDPSRPPFSGWASGELFWGKLLGLLPLPPRDEERAVENRGLARALGSRALAGLLGQHPEMPLPSLGWAFFMILFYLALVGPVDYLVLRRLRRMELTWITFPSCALVFSAAAVVAGSSAARLPPLEREISVADCLPDADVTCGGSVASLLTPQEERVSLAIRKSHAAVSLYDVYGGQGSVEARFGPSRVDDWSFNRGTTGAAVLRWCEKGAAVRAEPAGEGRIRVANAMGVPLSNAVYVRGRTLFHLGTVAPGAAVLDLKGPGQDLKEGLARLQLLSARQEEDYPDEWRYGPMGGGKEQSVRARIRGELASLSFGRALGRPAKGPGTPLLSDASRWIEDGGAVLLGWTEAPETVVFEGVRPRRTADALVRVFVRHD